MIARAVFFPRILHLGPTCGPFLMAAGHNVGRGALILVKRLRIYVAAAWNDSKDAAENGRALFASVCDDLGKTRKGGERSGRDVPEAAGVVDGAVRRVVADPEIAEPVEEH